MNPNQAIRSYLINDATISSLVGDRVVNSYAGRKIPRPYIVFDQLPGGEKFSNLGGFSEIENLDYGFQAIGENDENSQATVTSIITAIKSLFSAMKSAKDKTGDTSQTPTVYAKNIIYLTEADGNVIDPESQENVLYAKQIDYSFSLDS